MLPLLLPEPGVYVLTAVADSATNPQERRTIA
jgi:hypothetical protein